MIWWKSLSRSKNSVMIIIIDWYWLIYIFEGPINKIFSTQVPFLHLSSVLFEKNNLIVARHLQNGKLEETSLARRYKLVRRHLACGRGAAGAGGTWWPVATDIYRWEMASRAADKKPICLLASLTEFILQSQLVQLRGHWLAAGSDCPAPPVNQ
jgi:hypothetical protein